MKQDDLKNIELIKMNDFNGLIKQCKWYVYKVAKSLNKPEYFDDLIAAGNEGLWVAATRFNVDGEVPFIGYASMYVKGYMMTWLTTNAKTIKLPSNIILQLNRGEFECKTNTSSIDDSPEVKNIFEIEEEKPDFSNLMHYVDKLPSTEKFIIIKKFGLDGKSDPMTLKAVGNLIGISKQATSNKMVKALKLLKKHKSKFKN